MLDRATGCDANASCGIHRQSQRKLLLQTELQKRTRTLRPIAGASKLWQHLCTSSQCAVRRIRETVNKFYGYTVKWSAGYVEFCAKSSVFQQSENRLPSDLTIYMFANVKVKHNTLHDSVKANCGIINYTALTITNNLKVQFK